MTYAAGRQSNMRPIHARQCTEFVTNGVNGGRNERAARRLAVRTPGGVDAASPDLFRFPPPVCLGISLVGEPAIPLSAGQTIVVDLRTAGVNRTRHTDGDHLNQLEGRIYHGVIYNRRYYIGLHGWTDG